MAKRGTPNLPGPDRATDEAPTALSEDFLVELGRVTETFATLEYSLKALAGALVNREDEALGRIVTAQLSFRALLDLVGSLARYRLSGSPLLDEIVNALRHAEKVEQRRNEVTHSDLSPLLPGHTNAVRSKHVARMKKGLVQFFEEMTPADVRAIANDAASCNYQVVVAACRILMARRAARAGG
jgi:hypothetical protein